MKKLAIGVLILAYVGMACADDIVSLPKKFFTI